MLGNTTLPETNQQNPTQGISGDDDVNNNDSYTELQIRIQLLEDENVQLTTSLTSLQILLNQHILIHEEGDNGGGGGQGNENTEQNTTIISIPGPMGPPGPPGRNGK